MLCVLLFEDFVTTQEESDCLLPYSAATAVPFEYWRRHNGSLPREDLVRAGMITASTILSLKHG
jgi:hypothetical protein